MKIAIMQPYFLPCISYFQLINAVDKFIIYDDVNYIKKGWINRNNILLHGKKYSFAIPLKKASQNKKINTLSMSEEIRWKNKLFKTIENAYQKAPYFQEVIEEVKNIIFFEDNQLNTFVLHSIRTINQYLGINTQTVPSASIYQNQHLKGEQRIVDICLREKATAYINPIMGKSIYNKDIFEKKNISLCFLETVITPYRQFEHNFVPLLSIVDTMMFQKNKYQLLKQYKLS